MISKGLIKVEKNNILWRVDKFVEQDMILSRAIVSLYNNDSIKEQLAFRGGTALNKIFLNPSARYSEDIDLVRMKGDRISLFSQEIRNSLLWLEEEAGLGPPDHILKKNGLKYYYKFRNVDGDISKLKIEVNTREPFHVMPLQKVPFDFASEWWQGKSTITTYTLEEIMGTKLRAIYQRRKGRDIFDAWHVFGKGLADIEKSTYIFKKYNDYNGTQITQKMYAANLREKKNNADFRGDISPLLPPNTDYNFDTAFDFLMMDVIPLMSLI